MSLLWSNCDWLASGVRGIIGVCPLHAPTDSGVMLARTSSPRRNVSLRTMSNFHISFTVLRFLTMVCITVVPLTFSLYAEEPLRNADWGRFRGENGAARIPICDVPLPWSSTDVAWEMALPGKGNASPVLWGELAFVSSADLGDGQQHLYAIDLSTGRVKWHKVFPSRSYPIHARSSFASSTPCVTETAIYFSWANPAGLALVALRHDGSQLWQKDLGPYVSQHGFGCSLGLFGRTLSFVNS